MRKRGWGYSQSSAGEFIAGWKRTQGTETSKYLEEKKKTLIPSVAASEGGTAQTGLRTGVADTNVAHWILLRMRLDSATREGDSPVSGRSDGLGAPE